MSIPFQELVGSLGYFGLFVAVLVTSLSMFVGIPTIAYVALATAIGLDPLVSTIVAAVAGALGESPAYFIGLGSKKVLEKKYKDLLSFWDKVFRKFGFWAIVLISAFPITPDELAGFLAGTARYDYIKFLLGIFIGKLVKYMIAAFGGQIIGNLFS